MPGTGIPPKLSFMRRGKQQKTNKQENLVISSEEIGTESKQVHFSRFNCTSMHEPSGSNNYRCHLITHLKGYWLAHIKITIIDCFLRVYNTFHFLSEAF